MKPTLHTKRTTLSRLALEDAPALLRVVLENEPRLVASFPTILHQVTDATTARTYIQGLDTEWKNGTHYAYAIRITETNEFVGRASIKCPYPGAPLGELAYFIDRAHEGLGIMTEVAQTLIEEAFFNARFPVLYLRVGTENAASNRLAQKLGFAFEKVIEAGMLDRNNQPIDLNYYTLKQPICNG